MPRLRRYRGAPLKKWRAVSRGYCVVIPGRGSVSGFSSPERARDWAKTQLGRGVRFRVEPAHAFHGDARFHKLTFAQARAMLAPNIIIKRVEGEYRVNFRGGAEGTAYYTSDLGDAVSTGMHMIRSRYGLASRMRTRRYGDAMSRMHFQAVAENIAAIKTRSVREREIERWIPMLKRQNKRFDEARFRAAIEKLTGAPAQAAAYRRRH